MPLPRRKLLRTLGLGVAAVPGFQLLKARGQGLERGRGQGPRIQLEGPRKLLTVDAVMAAPDGVSRQIYAYGGRLLGPTIRVREGERLVIEIVNNLRVPTIVHWHGMHQPNSWQMDGVEGVSGPAIEPGRSFVYDFIATPAGTHWYHSHAGVQYSDGLFGPLIVEEKQPIARYDREEVLLINDWEHESADAIWKRLSTQGMGAMGGSAMAPGGMAAGGMATGGMGAARMPPAGMAESQRPLATSGLDALIRTQWGRSDLDWGDVPFRSGLVNGRGRATGSKAPLTQVPIREGEVLRLRLINGSATYSLRFQIDNHPLTVIASDGQPLQPVTVDNLLIGIGERYDVLVTGKGSGSHWIRATTGLNNTIKAVLRYGETAPAEPTTEPQPWRERFLAPSQLLSPREVNLEAVPFREIPMLFAGPEPVYRWSVNGDFYPDVKPIQIKKDEWIRMRFVNRTNMEHPFHIHGHSFYVLGTPDELNLRNPPLKDTLNIWPNAEQVIQWKASNPGHWIFHCHVEWHLAGGMASILHITP
ncbi:MAG: multicopper oxidase family protein [Synechococcaceae cyanobacterium]|nr:multicopper oxidase family protein [Synechococcaceae cyanobacterium]